MSGSEPREVYVVMCNDTVEGVYTDRLRAQDACAAVVRSQVDRNLAQAFHWKFDKFYLGGLVQVVWPRIVATQGALDA